jgi:hypothetical protein
MLMVTTFLPLLGSNLPPIIRSHHIWTPIWLISILLFVPKTFTKKTFAYVWFFGIILVFILLKTIWFPMSDWDKRQATMELYMFIIGFSLWSYFLSEKDFSGYAIIVKWTLIFVFITTLLSIFTSFLDPLYVRKLTGGKLHEIEELRKYGSGGYGFASSIICVIPMIFYFYRNPHKSILNKIGLIAFGITIIFAIFRMQIIANLIVVFIISIFSLVGLKKLKSTMIPLIGILLLIFIIQRQVYVGFFINISDYMPEDTEAHFKFKDFAQFSASRDQESASGVRAARYPLLFQAWKQSPFWGYASEIQSNDISEGAHLYWMNKLTQYGLFGFIPFMLIFYFHASLNIKYFDKEFSYYYSLSLISIIILGFLKTLAGRELFYIMFFIMPGMYFLPLIKGGYNQKKSGKTKGPTARSS